MKFQVHPRELYFRLVEEFQCYKNSLRYNQNKDKNVGLLKSAGPVNLPLAGHSFVEETLTHSFP